ncbi:MAG: hypothetical protein JNK26_01595 [Candidatus Doudnabacteria bacterium]|nr:hypothetical protein [Candidatus Doudnabacteria bacterium]
MLNEATQPGDIEILFEAFSATRLLLERTAGATPETRQTILAPLLIQAFNTAVEVIGGREAYIALLIKDKLPPPIEALGCLVDTLQDNMSNGELNLIELEKSINAWIEGINFEAEGQEPLTEPGFKEYFVFLWHLFCGQIPQKNNPAAAWGVTSRVGGTAKAQTPTWQTVLTHTQINAIISDARHSRLVIPRKRGSIISLD